MTTNTQDALRIEIMHLLYGHTHHGSYLGVHNADYNDLADDLVALITSQSAGEQSRIDELELLCAEAYQVIGVLADECGRFGDEKTIKVLDNLSDHKMIHDDVLPYPSAQSPASQEPVARVVRLLPIDRAEIMGYAIGCLKTNMALYAEPIAQPAMPARLPVATVTVGTMEHGPFMFHETAYGADKLKAGTYCLYAAPIAQSAMPVAHVDLQTRPCDSLRWTNGALPHGTALYAAPSHPIAAQDAKEAAFRDMMLYGTGVYNQKQDGTAEHVPIEQLLCSPAAQEMDGVRYNSSCQNLLREAGKPYPRTCAVCKLGPCHIAAQQGEKE